MLTKFALILALAFLLTFPAVGSAYTAPDPGGDETAQVALPPPGKYLGLNEDVVGGWHGLSHTDNLELARTIGGNAVRTTVDWRTAEPTEGTWDQHAWDSWKAMYEDALRRGMVPVMNVGFAPRWAREPAHRDCMGFGACEFPPDRAYDSHWARFVSEIARRFPRAIIEVWNEANAKIYWESGADPERFAELQAVAYDAVKAVSPSTMVLAGGLANVQKTADGDVALREFLQRAYDAEPSLRGHMDAISFHPYPWSFQLGANSLFAKSFDDVRSVRDAEGDGHTPLFVSEVGLPYWPNLVTEQQQADTNMRIYRRTITMSDVIGVVFHRGIEPKDTTGSELEHWAGWTRYGANPPVPRPVYCRFVAEAKRSYPGCPGELPLSVVLQESPASLLRSDRITFRFESPSFGVTYQCSLDSSAYSACWPGVTYSAGAVGWHTFRARARDRAGKLSAPVTHRFRTR